MTDVNEQGPAQDVHFAQPPPRLDYQQHETTLFAGQLATLLLRILAIYLVVVSLPGLTFYLVGLLGAWIQDNRLPTYALWPSIYGFIPLAAAGVLYWFATVIGRRLVRDSPRVQTGKINSYTAQAMAFSVLGVYLFAQAAPQLALQFARNSNWNGMEEKSGLIVPGVTAVLGLILFFQARGLAAVWHKLRNSGRYEEAGDRQEP